MYESKHTVGFVAFILVQFSTSATLPSPTSHRTLNRTQDQERLLEQARSRQGSAQIRIKLDQKGLKEA